MNRFFLKFRFYRLEKLCFSGPNYEWPEKFHADQEELRADLDCGLVTGFLNCSFRNLHQVRFAFIKKYPYNPPRMPRNINGTDFCFQKMTLLQKKRQNQLLVTENSHFDPNLNPKMTILDSKWRLL